MMKIFGRKKNRRLTPSTRQDALPRGLKDLAAQAAPPTGGYRGGDPSGLVLALTVVAVIAGAGLFRVWTRSETQRLGYAIVAAEARMRVAESEHARLTVEEATLSSPIRIAKVAQDRLGLHAPGPEQIVDVGATAPDDTELALGPTFARNARGPAAGSGEGRPAGRKSP